MMEVNLTEVLWLVICLMAALVFAFVLQAIRNKVGAQNMDRMLRWVEIAVAAAEQLFSSEEGEAKKAYALACLQEHGFAADTAELNMAIEAAVNRLHREIYGGGK